MIADIESGGAYDPSASPSFWVSNEAIARIRDKVDRSQDGLEATGLFVELSCLAAQHDSDEFEFAYSDIRARDCSPADVQRILRTIAGVGLIEFWPVAYPDAARDGPGWHCRFLISREPPVEQTEDCT